MIKCNVKALENYIKRATLNYCIEHIQLNIRKDEIISKLVSSSRECVTLFRKPNDILMGLSDTDFVSWNWKEPANSFTPFIHTLTEEVVPIEFDAQKVVFKEGKSKLRISLSIEDTKHILKQKLDFSKIDIFHEFTIDEEFFEAYNRIKKIAARFSKFYLTVKNNELFLETADKTNCFSNELNTKLCDVKYQDMFLNFDFKSFSSLMVLINPEDNYTMKLHYNTTSRLGMLFILSENEEEIFWLVSRQES